MVRPKKLRRITNQPKQIKNQTEIIKIQIDEYEAIRLRDYHNIKQKQSAELMGISQPTFHRILINARKKIAIALIDKKEIKIIGEIYMNNQTKYKCQDCKLEWNNPEKEYKECPSCNSKNIKHIINQPLNQRKSFGGPGLGKCQTSQQPKTECICPQCGYSTKKTKGIPCRNKLCPNCNIPLQGSNQCNIN